MKTFGNLSVRGWAAAVGVAMALLGPLGVVPCAVGQEAGRPGVLVLETPSRGGGGRVPFRRDALEAIIVAGTYRMPGVGDIVELPGVGAGGEALARKWREAAKVESVEGLEGAEGSFDAAKVRDEKLGGGSYVSVVVERATAAVEELKVVGAGMVYVNGEPRVGDPYALGYVRLPVALKAGRNELLFQIGRGVGMEYGLRPLEEAVAVLETDATLPDLIAGEEGAVWGAANVFNAMREAMDGWSVEAEVAGAAAVRTAMARVEGVSNYKAPFRIEGGKGEVGKASELAVRLVDAAGNVRATRGFSLRRVAGTDQHVRTFVSGMDASVQYYAVRPGVAGHEGPYALVLSVHGASVEATSQAGAYSAKRWAHIVCPTNRRPFGFDWEDWGRGDAMEVLEEAAARLKTDPTRVYLTGHSMGGHGTWQLGVLFPDRFAALAPSAGWIDFASYGGSPRPENPTPLQALFWRARSTSDTLAMKQNYAGRGVYVIHGDADDNVPVEQARRMREELKEIVPDMGYHEQPGAGHWWESSDEPGAECLDWAPAFDMFAARRLARMSEVRRVRFVTLNPGVSAKSYWVTVHTQERSLEASSVDIACDPHMGRFVGTTENVRALSVVTGRGGPLVGAVKSITLDGQTLDLTGTGEEARLVRVDGTWKIAEDFAGLKSPARHGLFKSAFDRSAVLVYATGGDEAENAWAKSKARYDAEQFWYRGNGALRVMPDRAFMERAASDLAECSVVLYGNSDTNLAWGMLLADSPVRVSRGAASVGDAAVTGGQWGAVFVRPRPGTAGASVGVVAGTGAAGQRLTDRLPYFVSGVQYPDYAIFGPRVLEEGVAGVAAAGFFDAAWALDTGQAVVSETDGDGGQ